MTISATICLIKQPRVHTGRLPTIVKTPVAATCRILLSIFKLAPGTISGFNGPDANCVRCVKIVDE